jgi:hypothetical protein
MSFVDLLNELICGNLKKWAHTLLVQVVIILEFKSSRKYVIGSHFE